MVVAAALVWTAHRGYAQRLFAFCSFSSSATTLQHRMFFPLCFFLPTKQFKPVLSPGSICIHPPPPEPNISKLTSMHFYGWKKGLKTGMYYLRTKPKADAIQFTVDQVRQRVVYAVN